jgi:hypothetical protein
MGPVTVITTAGGYVTTPTDGKLLIIHFHYSFVILVSARESMR